MQVEEAQRVLGVATAVSDTDAYRDEIKNAWRAAAKRYHPDAGARDADASVRFAEAKAAHETLLNASNGILPEPDDDGASDADDMIIGVILSMRQTLKLLINELVETQTAVDELTDELERQRGENTQLHRAMVALESAVSTLQVRADRAVQQRQPTPAPRPTPPAPHKRAKRRAHVMPGLDEAIEVLRNMRHRR